MNEKWIDNEKKEIYFLEWLSYKSGFSVKQILKNMRPENQGWRGNNLCYSDIYTFLKKNHPSDYLTNLFLWERSILKSNIEFWENLGREWGEIIYEYSDFKIKFSNLEIDYYKFKIKESDKKLKVKNLKI